MQNRLGIFYLYSRNLRYGPMMTATATNAIRHHQPLLVQSQSQLKSLLRNSDKRGRLIVTDPRSYANVKLVCTGAWTACGKERPQLPKRCLSINATARRFDNKGTAGSHHQPDHRHATLQSHRSIIEPDFNRSQPVRHPMHTAGG